MSVHTNIRLFELVQEFIPDKKKAKEFVSRLEETVNMKFNSYKETAATKMDLAQLESKLSKTILYSRAYSVFGYCRKCTGYCKLYA